MQMDERRGTGETEGAERMERDREVASVPQELLLSIRNSIYIKWYLKTWNNRMLRRITNQKTLKEENNIKIITQELKLPAEVSNVVIWTHLFINICKWSQTRKTILCLSFIVQFFIRFNRKQVMVWSAETILINTKFYI